MFSAEEFAGILSQWGTFAAFVSLAVSVLVAIVGVLPSIFITGANIILFGIYKGFFISWASEVIGATVSFYLYRYGFKKRLEKLGERQSLIRKITYAQGKKLLLLLFQGRLIPFVPSGVVTLAGAVSNVSSVSFIFITIIGKFPAMLLETMISYDIVNIQDNIFRLSVTLALLIVSYIIYRTTTIKD